MCAMLSTAPLFHGAVVSPDRENIHLLCFWRLIHWGNLHHCALYMSYHWCCTSIPPPPVLLCNPTIALCVSSCLPLAPLIVMQLYWWGTSECCPLPCLRTEPFHTLSGWTSFLPCPTVGPKIAQLHIVFLRHKSRLHLEKADAVSSSICAEIVSALFHIIWHWQMHLSSPVIPIKSNPSVSCRVPPHSVVTV